MHPGDQSVDSKIDFRFPVAPEGWGPRGAGRDVATSPCISGVPNKGGQNQKSKRTLEVTMMLLVPKRGFKDCPGFFNSTGRLPKRVTEHLRHLFWAPTFAGPH